MADIEKLQQRYKDLKAAMRSGVALARVHLPDETQPVNLRTDINASRVELLTIVSFLINHGIMSKEDYWRALGLEMEKEVRIYELQLKEITGTNIRLG